MSSFFAAPMAVMDSTSPLVEGFQGKTVADGDGHGDLLRHGVHGVHIAEVDDHRLVAEVLQGHIAEVEVDALHEHIGGNHLHEALRVDHRSVIADALQR